MTRPAAGDEPAAATPPARRRRLLAALAILVALGVGFGLGAAVQSVGAEPARSEPQVVQRLVRASPQCMEALDRADRALAVATRVQHHLGEHTKVMNDLFREKLSPEAALNYGMPSLISGARDSARLDSAMSSYRAEVRACDRGTP
ncbi:MAG TPA: hypothetical protein VKG45_13195 [Actinomycetes bacterium]|nr:hypothetical protein [Actinomycetes bacterium]